MNPSNHTVAKIKQIPQTCQGISHKFSKELHQMRAAVPHGKSFEKCARMTTDGTRKYQKRHQKSTQGHQTCIQRASKGYQIGAKTYQGSPK